MAADYDLLVVGGGINGCGIANRAAQSGLSVLLVERDDLAFHTSSRSSKLIHGGLRYLEYGEFGLVREALAEREVLMTLAPHLVRPLTFVLPVGPGSRPAWMLRAGLLLYDHLGRRRTLPPSRRIDPARDPRGRCLRPAFSSAFSFADCRADDARLVLANALQASEYGADIRTRTCLTDARRDDGLWHAALTGPDGTGRCVRVRALVNAAGPWVAGVAGMAGVGHDGAGVRLVKGSHVAVPRLYAGEHAYLLQNADRRVVFVLPYGELNLIGTTDVPFAGDPATVAIDPDETVYLCETVNRYFRTPVSPADVVWDYAGVRALYDDGAPEARAVTRDYRLLCDAPEGAAPLLSVFGGKLTTYRRLAIDALDLLAARLPGISPPAGPPVALPGGLLPIPDPDDYRADLARRHPWLPMPVLAAMVARHGSRCEGLLDGMSALADLGRDFGGGLYRREAEWLYETEWALAAEDVLWRRTRCALAMTPAEREAFCLWWRERFGGPAAAGAL